MSEKYSIFEPLKKGFNIFLNKDPTETNNRNYDLYSFLSSYMSSDRPDRIQLTNSNDRTIITPILNRIAVDCSNKNFRHVVIDKNTNRFISDVDSSLNDCLNYEANLDQTGRGFIKDLVMSMLDEGVVAVVPTLVDINPKKKDISTGSIFSSFEILKLRVGRIKKWYPDTIDVELYNEATMKHQIITVAKSKCAIIENPFYAVMNANQSVLKRLNRKLAILDVINENQGSDRWEMVLRLPYAVRSELRQEIAEKRRQDIETQLSKSKRGIVYLDNQEKLEPISRPLENQIMEVVNYLTSMLYGQLGMPKEIFEGNANEQQINNYNNSTIKPILNAIVDEFRRKFITKTARSQGHTINYYINVFEYTSIVNMADSADKLSRNAIMTPNEFRDILGLKPSDQPLADELSNKNMPINMQNTLPQNYYQEEPYYDNNENIDEIDQNENNYEEGEN